MRLIDTFKWNDGTVLPTPKNKGQINIGKTFPKLGTSIGTRQALYTNSSVRGA